jgi:hypothetical protein
MHQIEIPDIKFSTQIPSEIAELSTKDWIYFVGESLKMLAGNLSIVELKAQMLRRFLNLKTGSFNRLKPETKLQISENMFRLGQLIDFLFDENDDGRLTYNLAFNKNLIPKFWFKLRLWRGPADMLTDFTFLEYKDANAAYNSYQKTEDVAYLNQLVATIYRPAYLRKPKYKPESVAKRLKRVEQMPYALRWAIFLFYSACEQQLRTATIDIDGNAIDLELLYTETVREKQKVKKPKYEANTGLAGVALALAGTGAFGPIDKVYQQNLYDVILLLYKQRIEYLNELEQIHAK